MQENTAVGEDTAAEGTVTEDTVTDLGWRSNLVVDRCRELLAAFLRGDGPLGLSTLSIGTGLPEWDETPPDPPERDDVELLDPAPFDVSLDSSQISYLDPDGNVVAGPTPRLRVEVALAAGEPPVPGGETSYPLREFGLFGSLGAEAVMINYVRHPVIRKEAADALVRTIELTL